MRTRNPSRSRARREHDLEHGDQRPRTRLCFNPRRYDGLISVHDPDDITWLEVRCRVFENPKVGAHRVVETVDGHVRRGIDRLAALLDPQVARELRIVAAQVARSCVIPRTREGERPADAEDPGTQSPSSSPQSGRPPAAVLSFVGNRRGDS